MSWRRWAPVEGRSASAARSARSRAVARSGPSPTTASTRPPFVPKPPSGRRRATVPAWKTSAPPCRRRRGPRSGRRGAGRPGSRRPRARSPTVAPSRTGSRDGSVGRDRRRGPRRAAAGPAARRGGAGSPGSRGRRAGRWYSSRTRAVGGQHQAGVQEAAERDPAAGQLGEDRDVDRLDDGVDRRIVEVRQRRVGAHAAGVRAAVPVAQPLVVARRRQGDAPGSRRRPR